jgi:hypothetical protein
MGIPDPVEIRQRYLAVQEALEGERRMFRPRRCLLFDAEPGKLFVELGDLAAGVHHPLHTGPGRVGLCIDIQAQRVPCLAHAGARLELRPVGHDDVDLVVFGVDAWLHGLVPRWRRRSDRPRKRGPIAACGLGLKPKFDRRRDGPTLPERLSGAACISLGLLSLC